MILDEINGGSDLCLKPWQEQSGVRASITNENAHASQYSTWKQEKSLPQTHNRRVSFINQRLMHMAEKRHLSQVKTSLI